MKLKNKAIKIKEKNLSQLKLTRLARHSRDEIKIKQI
jgi:hypothetical protein